MRESRKNPVPRRYPPIYEKLIPIALVMIVGVIVVLAIISVLVMAGAFS